MTDLYALIGIFFANGLVQGTINTASNAFVLSVWGKESEPFIQTYFFFFGIGALVAPVFTRPFLIENEDVSEIYGQIDARNFTDDIQLNQEPRPEDLQLVYPYSIVGGVFAYNCVYFFLLWVLYPQTEAHPSQAKALAETSNPSDIEKSSENEKKQKRFQVFKVIVILLTACFMHIYYGLELTAGSLVLTYAVESDLKLSKSQGAELTALFWGVFTGWRLIAIFYIEYIGSELNIASSLAVILLGNVILIPFANSSEVCLWIGIALIGLGTSSIWGSMFSYLNDHFPVTSKISSVLTVSACVGVFIFPLIISNFVETNPDVFLWVLLSCSIVIVFLYILIILLMRLEMKKYV